MSCYEAWIGDCHMRAVEGGKEYYCQAAVWADNDKSFRARLCAHIEPQGYRILWLEDVLSATQYLKRHNAVYKIGALARAVHPHHLVELGLLSAFGAEGTAAPESYLRIEEIEGVEPLALQLGEASPKRVPMVFMLPCLAIGPQVK